MDRIWISRRAVLGMLTVAGLGLPWRARAQAPLAIKVWKDPNCGCCTGWVEHLRANGFAATVSETAAMSDVKARLGVPAELASCHTAEIESYIIEGHVPAHAIRRLLGEKSPGKGLAVPGMPVGSPGMEGGTPEIFDVVLFGAQPNRTFGRYKLDQPF